MRKAQFSHASSAMKKVLLTGIVGYLKAFFIFQNRIRHLAFITLDDTSESLASLPTSRQTALYSLAYSPYALSHITAGFAIQS